MAVTDTKSDRRAKSILSKGQQSVMRCVKTTGALVWHLNLWSLNPKLSVPAAKSITTTVTLSLTENITQPLPPNRTALSVVSAAPSAGLFADRPPDNRFRSRGRPAAACLRWYWPQRAPRRWAASSRHAAGLTHSQSWHLRPYGPLVSLEIAAFSCVIKEKKKK